MLQVIKKLNTNKYKKISINAKYLYLQILLEKEETNNKIELTNEKVKNIRSKQQNSSKSNKRIRGIFFNNKI